MGLLPSHRRALLLAASAAAALSLVAIVALDGPLAVALSSVPADTRRTIQGAVGVIELLFAFGASPYLYGMLLVVAGLSRFGSRQRSLVPWALLFAGLSHVTAPFLTDILKPPFSRLRPFEALGNQQWHDTWFAAVGNSFPSGHAAHFWSLFFPLWVLFPRYRAPLLILPLLVSAARVAVNDHYLSDVLASAAVAAATTWAYAIAVLDRGVKRLSGHPQGSAAL
jgi:membrane-associated phospholipid phosphatase